MSGVIATIPKYQFSSATGAPLANGTLTVYVAGSTTPTNTWQDSALTTLNTNPITLDSRGECVLWLDSAVNYKFVLKNAGGVIQWTQDNISGAARFADLAASTGSSLVGHLPSGAGAVATTVQSKLRESVSVKDFGAKGDGTTDDSTAFLLAAAAVRSASTDSTGRTFAGTVFLPSGNFKITSAIALALSNGVTGLTFQGAGSGSTIITFSGATATLSAVSSRAVTFKDIGFTSSGVDDNQTAFTVAQTGNPLRSWRFERCEFSAFWKCFAVSGTTMCSEFFFKDCQFSQCYILMDNSNAQAVNWNFLNCNWENDSLSTVKDKNLSAIFSMQKGTFVNWSGGSLIFYGMLAYYNLTASGSFQRTAHKITFSGVRLELVDTAGSHARLVDKVSAGYVNGSNQPTTSLSDFTILNRGTIPSTADLFAVWGNCSLSLMDGECSGGYVVGILDGVTAASNASVVIQDVRGINYREDTTARVNTHDQHNVTLVPDVSSAGTSPIVDYRLCSLSVPASVYPKRIYVRGPTGSIPQGGTTVNLPTLPDHTMILRLWLQRFAAAAQSLTVELKDQADTTVYQTISLVAGDRFKEDTANAKEMGFQIPSGTALMLKFTGVAEVVKGIVGVEYI